MAAERLFVDTAFLMAVFNQRDQYHEAAMRRDHALTDALTCDQHFVQAGFRALLLEEAQ